MSLDDIDSGNDIQELTISTGNVAIEGRFLRVVAAGAGTKKLKVKTASGQDRTLTVKDDWVMPLKITLVYGTTDGVTSITTLQVVT
jgi:hypothetical protein